MRPYPIKRWEPCPYRRWHSKVTITIKIPEDFKRLREKVTDEQHRHAERWATINKQLIMDMAQSAAVPAWYWGDTDAD